MCGIAGIVGAPGGGPVSRRELAQMARALVHRGPDEEGLWQEGPAGLAHRRLQVIDPKGGAQPFSGEQGRVQLVFNGEIYNHRELRAELERAGQKFFTRSDTEVLLRLYLDRGEEMLADLVGMFAFAIWDARQGSLFLARDRVGKKPLYYAETGGRLAFASELGALRRVGLAGALDAAAISSYLETGWIGAEQSAFKDVRKLPPGCFARWRDGRLHVQRYWQWPLPGSDGDQLPKSEVLARGRLLLDEAVACRLESDVPLGAVLSGGIDSALVCALAARQMDGPLRTFTVGFGEAGYDERPGAADTARHLGTDHLPIAMPQPGPELAERVLAAFGEPFADSSALPTYLLCKAVREHVTVALSGDGGDEVFAGYSRYRAARIWNLYRRFPKAIRQGLIARAVRLLPDRGAFYQESRIRQAVLFCELEERIEAGRLCPRIFSPRQLESLGVEGDRGTLSTKEAEFSRAPGLSLIEKMIAADLSFYLPDDILVKVDRMSMAHGLEIRSPLLDHRVAQCAVGLPLAWKLRRGQAKYLLRECAAGALPAAVLRRKKHGFVIPMAAWLRSEPWRSWAAEHLSSQALASWVEPREATRLWEEHQKGRTDHGQQIWTLAALSVFLRDLGAPGRGIESST